MPSFLCFYVDLDVSQGGGGGGGGSFKVLFGFFLDRLNWLSERSHNIIRTQLRPFFCASSNFLIKEKSSKITLLCVFASFGPKK